MAEKSIKTRIEETISGINFATDELKKSLAEEGGVAEENSEVNDAILQEFAKEIGSQVEALIGLRVKERAAQNKLNKER